MKAWGIALVITHIFDSVSYSVQRYSYSKHPGTIEYEYENTGNFEINEPGCG
jgi:hypothetical protein